MKKSLYKTSEKWISKGFIIEYKKKDISNKPNGGYMGIILGIIPARGGSKGIPGKNIKELMGKPLIAYTIEAAQESSIDKVIVSTEDIEIAKIATDYDCDVVMRPKELATDTSITEDAMIHAVKTLEKENIEIDIVVLLQPTSVFRTTDDINSALKKFKKDKVDSLLSVFPSHLFLWKENKEKDITPVNYDPHYRPMRQQLHQFAENGAIYITKKNILLKEKSRLGGKIALYVMNQEHSLEIDTNYDWWLTEQLFQAEDSEYSN